MRAWVLGACATACAPNTAGVGSGGAGGVNQDDTADDGSAGPGSGTGATSQGSADGTGGGSGAATDDAGGSTTNPPPPPPPPPIDTGDSDTAGDTAAGSTTGEDVPPPPPDEELLEHATFGGCIEPLWCYSGDVFNPAGGAMWMQECFTASLAPPFELVELEVVVRGLAAQVTNVDVEVYANNGAAGPGPLLGSRSVDVAGLGIGSNIITVDTPISINQANICIGVAAPDAGLAGALGVAVNEGFTQGDVSFFRLQGGGGCNHPAWTDVIDLNPNPAGNWCIRGTIREL